mmetsp:Transcript_156003/g.500250  ORF Transcript_156003/g.500250 Transcript_156003/m.500250 type:complete len:453 (+) Transcript_156003:105-1463(+)|eukprot:CAMPEP_0203923330 /NCGR_PEP_ID=MMETSP0359-20131031/63256_1 /ASSEMBLY_ACC=CAM_ASM_000338 /TAXON_ID=268821 /ORGANISM="Scrippsiella Hangoei, Strain SHTV-5" /LENGTH=452 /DNA_ID=CAMNT_0050851389 /DNA_START=80 /DNA_END=1438 /DNA_ORIENTATION=-
MLNSITQGARGIAQSSSQGLSTVGQNYAPIADSIQSYVKEKAGLNMQALADAGYGLPAVGPKYEAAKKAGTAQLFDLGAPVRAKVMFSLKCSTQEAATADPDMPSSIRERVKGMVDVFWSDLTVFTEQMFEDQKLQSIGKLADTVDELGAIGKDTAPMMLSPRWWRAFCLYRIKPFDRSIFGQIKDPVFWFFTILSLFTGYGIRIWFFAFVLMLIVTGCPADEFQLVSYILGFKGSQFISSGIIQACIAAVRYYMCVHPGGTHTCDVDGPGAREDIVSGLSDFLGSCILTWVAFFFLPCSGRSAGSRVVGEATPAAGASGGEQQAGCFGNKTYDLSKGGRLTGLLGWDITAFLLSCCFAYFLMYVDSAHLRPGGEKTTSTNFAAILDDVWKWQGHTAIFWARVFYAMLCFPFMVFLIPGLNSILTHTTATGYNRNGACVPCMLHPMPENKNK